MNNRTTKMMRIVKIGVLSILSLVSINTVQAKGRLCAGKSVIELVPGAIEPGPSDRSDIKNLIISVTNSENIRIGGFIGGYCRSMETGEIFKPVKPPIGPIPKSPGEVPDQLLITWEFEPPLKDLIRVECYWSVYLEEDNDCYSDGYSIKYYDYDTEKEVITIRSEANLGWKVTPKGDVFLLNPNSSGVIFDDLEIALLDDPTLETMELWASKLINGTPFVVSSPSGKVPAGTSDDPGVLFVGTFPVNPGEILASRATTRFEDSSISSNVVTSASTHEGQLIELAEFKSVSDKNNVHLTWLTGSEVNNVGFRLLRGIKNNAGNYEVTPLRELGYSKQINPEPNENCSTKIRGQLEANNSGQPPKLISAIGNSAESTCYSFTDTSNLNDGTYYYLLEDIGGDGKSTFHCDHINAVTVGQGSAIDLESTINYCKEITDSNN